MSNWDRYAEYCNDVYERDFAYDDSKENDYEMIADISDNVNLILDELSYNDLKGKDALQDSLFNLCDLLNIDTKKLYQKIANDQEVA